MISVTFYGGPWDGQVRSLKDPSCVHLEARDPREGSVLYRINQVDGQWIGYDPGEFEVQMIGHSSGELRPYDIAMSYKLERALNEMSHVSGTIIPGTYRVYLGGPGEPDGEAQKLNIRAYALLPKEK